MTDVSYYYQQQQQQLHAQQQMYERQQELLQRQQQQLYAQQQAYAQQHAYTQQYAEPPQPPDDAARRRIRRTTASSMGGEGDSGGSYGALPSSHGRSAPSDGGRQGTSSFLRNFAEEAGAFAQGSDDLERRTVEEPQWPGGGPEPESFTSLKQRYLEHQRMLQAEAEEYEQFLLSRQQQLDPFSSLKLKYQRFQKDQARASQQQQQW